MTNLVNQEIPSTFGDVLTCTNNGNGLTTVQSNLQDGLGNNSPILIATTSVNFNRGLGQFQLDGDAVTATSVNINSMCQANPIALGNASFRTPKGTSVQRPGSPQAGDFRFNTDISNLEFYTGSMWQGISAGGSVTSITGTAGQINVANPTTTPVLSLDVDLTNIESITSPTTLTLNSGGASITVDTITNVVSNVFTLRSGCIFQINNPSESAFIQFHSSSVLSNSSYFFPSQEPTTNNQGLICDASGLMHWEEVQLLTNRNLTGSTVLAKNTRNIINAAAPVTLLLPVSCEVGDIIKIVGNLSNWTITQNASQIIRLLSQATTVGVGGSLASSNTRDCVELTCVVANTEFTVSGHEGTLVFT